MKKLIFPLFLIMISFSSWSQDKNLNGIATIKIPSQNAAVDINRVKSVATSSGRKVPLTGDPKNKALYRIGNMLLSVSVANSTKATDLTKFKKDLDALNSLAPNTYTSTLKLVNGVQVLTTHRRIENEGIFSVFTVNRSGTSSLNFTVDYPIGKDEEAKSIISDLLESIRFAKN